MLMWLMLLILLMLWLLKRLLLCHVVHTVCR
jgi:hypothetical protein